MQTRVDHRDDEIGPTVVSLNALALAPTAAAPVPQNANCIEAAFMLLNITPDETNGLLDRTRSVFERADNVRDPCRVTEKYR